jgi:chromosome segregation ATPase
MLTEVTQERIRARDHLNQSIAEVEAASQWLAAAGAALASAEADVAGRTTARNSAKARLSECEGDLEKVRARQADLKEKIDELIHRRSRLSSAAQPPR